MRTSLPAALPLLLAAALAGCGSSGGAGSTAATAPATTAPPATTPAAASAATTAAEELGPNPIDAQGVDGARGYVVEEWSDQAYEATDLRFLPDGRALVITKGGWGGAGTGLVQLLDAQGRFVRTLLEVPVCSDAERGLVGLEVDPAFASTQRIYLFYTRQMSGCALAPIGPGTPDAPVWNRVSSYTFAEDGIDPASERVLVDDIPGHQSSHNGGGLSAMPDGTLLIAAGEATYGRSRDLDFPSGKVLRIKPGARGGQAPADNPYADAEGSPVRRIVYASGLRNPFRIAADPDTGDVAAADVGTDDWEEVDLLAPGGDYGYPDVEGPGTVAGTLPPAFAYRHGGGCNSVIGGAWRPPSFVDGATRSVYVFSDLGCPGVWALEPGDPVRVTRIAADLPKSLASVVAGPDGAVYLVAIGPGPGPVYRLARAG